LDRIAGQAGEVAGQLGEGLTTPSATANTLGRGFQRLASGEASGSDFGRELGELGGEAVRGGFQSAVRGAGALRRGASNVLSGVFEGLGLPTDLLEENSALSRAGEVFSGRPGADGPPPDIAAEDVPDPSDGLTPRQRLNLTKFGSGNPANLTNEEGAPTVQEQADFFRSTGRPVEEIGNEVARPGAGGVVGATEAAPPGRTTAIRGTQVSQAGGGDDGDIAGLEEFGEGFEVPVGTTSADLRDPLRRQQLVARNSLSQSLRQVPAPGQTAIPAAVQAKMLADFDEQAAAERGATTRSRERNASLERRTAFSNAVTSRLGLTGTRAGGGKRFTAINIPRGEGPGGNLGSEAIILDTVLGTRTRVPVNRSRAERDTEDNRKQLTSDLRDVNPGITDAEIGRIFRFWVANGEFPPGIDFNASDSGGFLDGLF